MTLRLAFGNASFRMTGRQAGDKNRPEREDSEEGGDGMRKIM